MSDEADIMHLISLLVEACPDEMTPIGAGILAAASLGIAKDSRSFARKLGLAHALVLRECVILAEELHMIVINKKDERTQRMSYDLTPYGSSVIEQAQQA